MRRALPLLLLLVAACYEHVRPDTVPDSSGNEWMVISCSKSHPSQCIADAHYECPDGYRVRGDDDDHEQAARTGELLIRCEGHGR